MTTHIWSSVLFDTVYKLIFIYSLDVSRAVLTEDIINQLLHVTRSSVFRFATYHYITSPIIATIHEVLVRERIRVIYFACFNHGLISPMLDLRILPFFTHVQVVFLLLLIGPLSTL